MVVRVTVRSGVRIMRVVVVRVTVIIVLVHRRSSSEGAGAVLGCVGLGFAMKRVLVVDDNVDSGEMLVLLIEALGHEAVHCPDGPSALAKAKDLRPDVVILDVGLPGMDGYEVATRLRGADETKSARMFTLSGYGEESDLERSKTAGCEAHLLKPVDTAAIERLVGRA